jgi:hypothetical protein
MANWQRHLYLNPEWQQAKDGSITIQALAAVIAKRLRALRPFGERDEDLNEKRDEIAEEFEYIAKTPDATRDDFDNWMCDLYDWGDTRLEQVWNGKKVCWVDTMSRKPRSSEVERAQ